MQAGISAGVWVAIIAALIALISVAVATYFGRRTGARDDRKAAAEADEREYQNRVKRLLLSPEFEARVTEITVASERIRDFMGRVAMESATTALRESETVQGLNKVLEILETDIGDLRRMLYAAMTRDADRAQSRINRLPIKKD